MTPGRTDLTMQTATRTHGLSVVLVDYNSGEFIETTITSIRRCFSSVELQIILVTSLESSTCDRIQRDPFFRGCEIVVLDQNRGFGHCNNVGAQRAKFSILGLVNPDIEFVEDATQLFATVSLALSNSRVGICTPTLLNSDRTLQQATASFTHSLRSFVGAVRKHQRMPDWTIAACIFLQTEDFLAVQGFDERIFMYCEDEELCMRFRRTLHKRVQVLINHHVVHFGGSSIAQLSEIEKYKFRSRNIEKNLRYIWQKYFGKIGGSLLTGLRLVRHLVLFVLVKSPLHRITADSILNASR